jgi:hypothetical protein
LREGSNIEIAEKLSEQGEHGHAEASKATLQDLVEIVEAILLAVVAIATAWSGYQAARWDGRQSELYGEASTLRIAGDELVTLGGQQRLLDVSTFNTWIQARNEGREKLAALYVRRFSQEFKVAFDAWLKTKPFSNPTAPPGPSFMPQYDNGRITKGVATNHEANRVFEEGTAARRQSDDYVRTTVVLATVLFLLALSQRFKLRRVRLGLLVPAGALMIYALVTILSFPRL